MISRWFSDEPSLYSKSKIESIVNAYPWRASRDKAELGLDTLHRIIDNRSIVAVLLALPYALLVVRGGRKARLAVLGSMLAAVSLLVILAVTKKSPPERVFFPLLSFPLATSLLSFAWRSDQKDANSAIAADGMYLKWLWSRSTWLRQPLRVRVILVLMIVATVMGVYRQARRSSHVHRDRVVLERFLRDVRPSSENLYVVWGWALPYELVSPLDSLGRWSGASFLSLSWNQGAPWHEAIKRRHGISNLSRAICERNDVVLVAMEEDRTLFATFAKEHFGDDVEFVASFTDKKFAAGRFHPRSTKAQTATKPTAASRR
jgi:hypothetical protein